VDTQPAVSLAHDRESSLTRTGALTTMLRHQLANMANMNDTILKIALTFA